MSADDEEDLKAANPVLDAIRKIAELHGKDRGVVGVMPCTAPGCAGRLRYLVSSYNGHPRGHCETCGLSFIC